MNLIEIPKFKIQARDRLGDGAEYIKLACLPKTICLQSEYAFYLKKFKRVYRVDLSLSTRRWVLSVDDGTWGWDQRGFYVRTLCSAIGHRPYSDLASALARALRFLPEEAAFFCPTLMEYQSNDPEFEKWFSRITERL